MDDIQVVESKALLVDKELPVCILNGAKYNSDIISDEILVWVISVASYENAHFHE